MNVTATELGILHAELVEANAQNRKLIAQNAELQNEVRKLSSRLTQISTWARGL